jgi:hypothetical protein
VTETVDVVTSNVENNGGGNPVRWREAHEKLARLQPHLLMRQEVWDAAANAGELATAAEQVLGMRGWIGEGSCTALYVDPATFTSERGWPASTAWQMAPTARTLRLNEAGEHALPLIGVAAHLTYSSRTRRMIEAEELTTYLDKDFTTVAGRTVKLPALIGADRNSYTTPVPGAVLPTIETFSDLPHQTHRSRPGADGGARVPDTYPDEELRAAGAIDAASYVALNYGQVSALEPTVVGKPTQGDPTAVDGLWVSKLLLPALVDVDVIDMTGLSDHHAVRVRFNRSLLVDLLRLGALVARTK